MSLIELHGLTKLYEMGDSIVRALDGVDLQIDAGEFIAITGPSGSGKSTMMHLLGCLDRPTHGRYVLNGQVVSELSDRQLAVIRNRQIGFVFQTFNLINRTTALENVGVPLFYARNVNTRTPALAALDRVGLAHRASHRPNELSGGERQRVAIARAIVNNPAFLLADEPTGNLDTRTGEQIMKVFHDLNAHGVTIVLVTHEPDIALQARRIVQMRDGRIVADRPTSELRGAASGAAAVPGVVTLIAPHGASNDSEREPAAPLDDPAGEDRSAHARLADGANATLACGVVAASAFAGAYVVSRFITPPTPAQTAAGAAPSASTSAMMLAVALLALVGVVAAVIAVFWARGVFRRARKATGSRRGLGRARLGAILGWTVIAVPVLAVSCSVLSRALGGAG